MNAVGVQLQQSDLKKFKLLDTNMISAPIMK